MKRMVFSLSFLLFVSGMYAQITLEECQRKTQVNYPLVHQYGLVEKTKEYNLENAAKGYLPQFALSAKASYQSDVTELPVKIPGVELKRLPKDQYQVMLELQQKIWDGGGIRMQKKQTIAEADVEKEKLNVDMYSLNSRVNDLYFGILLLDEQLRQNALLQDELGFKEITLSQNPEAIESFVAVIQEAIRELRNCYSELVGNIEQYLLKTLRLEEVGFSDYHHLIAERYKSVKTELMPVNMRNFQTRLVGNYDDKTTWIEAVSYVALNKPLTEIRDTDKSFLLATLKDMLFQLDDYVEMHKTASEDVIRLHITQNKSKAVTTQVILSEAMRQEVNSLENKLESILSGDNSLDVAALIAILKKKLK